MSRAAASPHWFARCRYGPDAPVEHNALTRRLRRGATGGRGPWLLNVAGTVGSGKSTLIRRLHALIRENHSVVQLDAIMEAYPSYRADLSARGAERAFARWERTAWATGFDVMAGLTRRRRSILLELSASHPSHPGFLAAFSRHGYRTCMILLNAPEATCELRARRRLKTDGRHVPPDYVASRRRKILRLRPRYRKLVDLYLEIDDAARLDEKAVLAFARRRP